MAFVFGEPYTTDTAEPLQIFVGPTWIKFKSNPRGILPNGVCVRDFIRHHLQQREWNPKINTFVCTYNFTSYDYKEQLAVFPRYSLDTFLAWLGDTTKVQIIEVPPIEPKSTIMKMQKGFAPRDNQQELIDFMVDNRSYFKPVSAQTGVGKTVVSEFAMAHICQPALIILGQLISQWYKSIRSQMKIQRKDIYVIQGFDSLKLLWEMLDHKYRPKIVIASTRTLLNYAVNPQMPYNQLRPYQALCKKIGFGIKIIDELHLGFYGNTQLDLVSNIYHNIYLSATYMRSDYQGKKLFNMIYPEELRFGDQFVKKYSVAVVLQYHLGIYSQIIPRFKGLKGYMHTKYEKYLLRKVMYMNTFMDQVLIPVINMYFIDKRQPQHKLLILCQTKQFVLDIEDRLTSTYPNLKVTGYFSGDRGRRGKPENLEKEIIVSTMKSCSTGVDIKNLFVCINTVSFASEPQAAQAFGRLRQIPNTETTFIDLWNGEIPTHQFHVRSRLGIYRTKALRVEEAMLN